MSESFGGPGMYFPPPYPPAQLYAPDTRPPPLQPVNFVLMCPPALNQRAIAGALLGVFTRETVLTGRYLEPWASATLANITRVGTGWYELRWGAGLPW